MRSFQASILLLGVVSALIPRSPLHLRRKLFDDLATAADDYPQVETHWFNQTLDHFDSNNTATWKQKYYYNPTFSRKNNIIFLMIGGEGPESKKWSGNPSVQYLQWANETGADVFDLEHRFFGDSFPINDMNTESLKYLTTKQALADLANFITQMNIQYNFTNPRWVTFGGSYPGSLSAWFRSKYPELTVGAVASSAPVNLKLDFYEYAMVVQDNLYMTDPMCAQATAQAFTNIQKLVLTADGRKTLSQKLNLAPAFNEATLTKQDITNLFGNLFNTFQGMTQYTYDGQSDKTHYNETDAKLCKIMTDSSVPDVVDRIANLNTWFNGINGANNNQLDNDYTADMTFLSSGNLTVLGEDGAAARGWMWLCCNEIGFMQTTDQGQNIFGSTVTLNLFIDMCTDMFGPTITMDHVFSTNKVSQDYYGGAEFYKATNIILPNGSLDPWHALGMYNLDVANNVTPLLINGAAHCSDMYPSYDGEPAALKPARALIRQKVLGFLTNSGGNPTTSAPTTPAATTPVVTNPAVTTPVVTTPVVTTPVVTTPAVTTPVVTTPVVTTPVVTTPVVTTPVVTTPAVTTPVVNPVVTTAAPTIAPVTTVPVVATTKSSEQQNVVVLLFTMVITYLLH